MLTVLLLSQFRRSKKGKNTAFRESFGQLGQLRSFYKQGYRIRANERCMLFHIHVVILLIETHSLKNPDLHGELQTIN